ncbi:hypothetical protein J7J59_06110 [Candidatus Aerophobetes bacterium]|nr:hypothetical protein [Candidatus Aerophobetes bacterium]
MATLLAMDISTLLRMVAATLVDGSICPVFVCSVLEPIYAILALVRII